MPGVLGRAVSTVVLGVAVLITQLHDGCSGYSAARQQPFRFRRQTSYASEPSSTPTPPPTEPPPPPLPAGGVACPGTLRRYNTRLCSDTPTATQHIPTVCAQFADTADTLYGFAVSTGGACISSNLSTCQYLANHLGEVWTSTTFFNMTAVCWNVQQQNTCWNARNSTISSASVIGSCSAPTAAPTVLPTVNQCGECLPSYNGHTLPYNNFSVCHHSGANPLELASCQGCTRGNSGCNTSYCTYDHRTGGTHCHQICSLYSQTFCSSGATMTTTAWYSTLQTATQTLSQQTSPREMNATAVTARDTLRSARLNSASIDSSTAEASVDFVNEYRGRAARIMTGMDSGYTMTEKIEIANSLIETVEGTASELIQGSVAVRNITVDIPLEMATSLVSAAELLVSVASASTSVPLVADGIRGEVQIRASNEAATFPSDRSVTSVASVTIPVAVLAMDTTGSFVGISITEYANASLFNSSSNDQIGSTVVSIDLTLPASVTANLAEPVCSIFVYSGPDSNLNNTLLEESKAALGTTYHSPKCTFYDNVTNAWKSDGCSTLALNSTHAQCCCTHLTSFAVIVSGDPVTNADLVALTYITFVGLGLSLAFILLTIFTVLAVSELRSELRYQILLSMVTALAIAQLLFFFITIPTDTDSCKAVSFMLLYFLLAYFCWMNVEAYDLYKTFVVVFQDGLSKKTKFVRFCLFAWGVPLIITVLGLADLKHMIKQDTATAGDVVISKDISYCWIDDTSSIFLIFVVPMAISLLVNMIISAHVIRIIHKNASHGRAGAVWKSFKIAGSISSVTGLSWIAATLLLLNIGGIASHYIFTILNVFQGCLIFYFHIWSNEHARKFYQSIYGGNNTGNFTSSMSVSSIRRPRGHQTSSATEGNDTRFAPVWAPQGFSKSNTHSKTLSSELFVPEVGESHTDSDITHIVCRPSSQDKNEYRTYSIESDNVSVEDSITYANAQEVAFVDDADGVQTSNLFEIAKEFNLGDENSVKMYSDLDFANLNHAIELEIEFGDNLNALEPANRDVFCDECKMAIISQFERLGIDAVRIQFSRILLSKSAYTVMINDEVVAIEVAQAVAAQITKCPLTVSIETVAYTSVSAQAARRRVPRVEPAAHEMAIKQYACDQRKKITEPGLGRRISVAGAVKICAKAPKIVAGLRWISGENNGAVSAKGVRAALLAALIEDFPALKMYEHDSTFDIEIDDAQNDDDFVVTINAPSKQWQDSIEMKLGLGLKVAVDGEVYSVHVVNQALYDVSSEGASDDAASRGADHKSVEVPGEVDKVGVFKIVKCVRTWQAYAVKQRKARDASQVQEALYTKEKVKRESEC